LKSSLTNLAIHGSITNIGQGALENCTRLTSASSIGPDAFTNRTSLTASRKSAADFSF
jgi:hypothetical protein